MKDDNKTKKALISELSVLRGRLARLETIMSAGGDAPLRGDDFKSHHSFLQAVIDEDADPIIVVDTDHTVKLMNRAARRSPFTLGRPDRLPCHRLFFNLDEPCHCSHLACTLKQVLETGLPATVEREHQLPGKSKRIYEIQAAPLRSSTGRIQGIVESWRDITEHKQFEGQLEELIRERTAELLVSNEALKREIVVRQRIEDELKMANEQANLIYRMIPSAIFTVDLNRRITNWNDKAAKITGYQREEVIGKECRIFTEHPCSESCGLYSNRVKKPVIDAECTIKTKDGRLLTISKTVDLLTDKAGRTIGGIECFEDITHRKEAEKVLRTERDKFYSMLAALGQGMHILNREYVIENQNDILRKQFGDRIGQKCYAVYKGLDAPCDNCRMQEAVETNEIQRTELQMSDGRYYEQSYAPFKDVDGTIKVLIMLRDITDEKAYQAETMRAGQLASIGELAAGVAHEINNPINGIINYAQVLRDQTDPGHGDSEILARIIREGERIAAIVSNLLAFARDHNEEVDYVMVGTVIDDALALINHKMFKDGILVSVEVPEDLPLVKVNPQQLQQVFLNLLSNARYALNQRFSGKDPEKKLIITCRALLLDDRTFVRIRFTDQGIGIPAEMIDKIFDPFVSTKKPGEGTGLGLSISHGLVKDFHGFLRVESVPDQYTTLIIDLPGYTPAGGQRNGEEAS